MSLYVPGGAPALKAPRSYGSKPITAQSYEGHTTVTGTPSPDNPATLTPVEPPAVPGAARQIGPLWSLPDGTRDTYDGETGVLVRRVGKLVLDGTENQYEISDLGSVIRSVIFNVTSKYPGTKYIFNSANGLCSHFNYLCDWEQDSAHFYVDRINVVIYIPKNLLSSVSADAVKSWLAAQATAGTPVTVLYELAQPTVDHLIYTGPISTRATDILAQSWEGKTTMIGDPSPDNPATISGVPFQATATSPDGQTRSVDLGFTGYSLPDGTSDSYNGKDGNFVQRVGKLVLDGTENWIAVNNFYYLHISDAREGENGNQHQTHFPEGPSTEIMDFETGVLNTSKNYCVNFDNGAGGVDNFKSWLSAQAAAGTPVTVYYVLAEPIVYNKKADITAFDGQTTVTGADTVEVIEGRVLRVADCLPFEIVRSNRNLLDNPNFAINQRGQNSYIAANQSINIADRWQMSGLDNENAKITLEKENYILLESVNALRQHFDPNGILSAIKNRTVTFSALIQCISGAAGQIGAISNGKCMPSVALLPKDPGWHLISCTIDIPDDVVSFSPWFYSAPGGVYRIYGGFKLELGAQQTLARKIGDQWVLNDPPPDYGLELLKCQRYFLRQNYEGLETIGNSNAGTTWLNLSIALPVSMRLNIPRCTITCKPTRVVDNLVLPAIAQVRAKGTQANLGFSLTGDALASYIYAGQAGYIDFDANL